MKKLLLSLALLPICGFSALPPLAQSLREMNAILNSKEITQYFEQGEALEEIRHDGNNYIVRTRSKQMMVEVIYTPKQKKVAGPVNFQLVFKPATPAQIKK